MRTCNTELAKHMFPVLIKPFERIFGGVEGTRGVVRSVIRDCFFAGVRVEKRGDSLLDVAEGVVERDEDAEIEKPTTEDVGSRDVEAAPGFRSEAQDFLGGGGD